MTGTSWVLTVATFWERMFSALVQFKTEHGHCDVPAKWSENPQLGKWTNNQRTVFKRGELSSDRLERLEAIGFDWDIRGVSSRRTNLIGFTASGRDAIVKSRPAGVSCN